MSEVKRIARGKLLDLAADKEIDNIVRSVPVRDSSKPFTVKNLQELRSYDASSCSIDQLANILGTLIKTLQETGSLKNV